MGTHLGISLTTHHAWRVARIRFAILPCPVWSHGVARKEPTAHLIILARTVLDVSNTSSQAKSVARDQGLQSTLPFQLFCPTPTVCGTTVGNGRKTQLTTQLEAAFPFTLTLAPSGVLTILSNCPPESPGAMLILVKSPLPDT